MVVKDRLIDLIAARDAHFGPNSSLVGANYNNSNQQTTNLAYHSEESGVPGMEKIVITSNPEENEDNDNTEFLNDINQIKAELAAIKHRVETLKLKYNASIHPTGTDTHEEIRLREEINNYKFETDNLVANVNNQLKSMKKQLENEVEENRQNRMNDIQQSKNLEVVTAQIKARKSHYNILTLKFKEILQEYGLVHQNYKNRLKAKLKRELRIIGHFDFINNSSTNNEDAAEQLDQQLEEMIETGNFQVFDEGFTKIQENKDVLNRLEKRAKDMEALEKSMIELRDIFVQVHQLVEQQGHIVNNIMENMEETECKVDEATEQLRQAAVYQSGARRKKICIALVCVILIAVLILILCLTLIK